MTAQIHLYPFTTLFRSGDHAEEGRLAAAGGADQHAELAVADIDIDALDGLEAAGIGLADVAQGNVSHQNSLLTSRSRPRSEEHTSELQSRPHLVCRLLL